MNDNETAICGLVANVKATVTPLDNRQVGDSSPAHAHTPTSPLASRFQFPNGTLLRSGFLLHGGMKGGAREEV